MTPNAHLSAQEAQRQHGFSRHQRLLFALVSIIAPLLIFPASAWSADVCERYTDLANEAKAEYREEDALNFLRRATGACQNFESSYELGRLAASFGEDELNAEAAKAFTEAYDFASTSKEEAAAIGRYAELVFYTQGDPQRAMDYALQARALDPTTPWVSELVTTINERANILTAQDIQRSVLSDLALAPLRLKRNADVDESTPQDPQAVGGELARTINIPLNFVVGSTDLDLRTASNLDVLAGEISKPAYTDFNFQFVGHADVRGSEATNQRLSEERAQTIYNAVVNQSPALAPRISVAGAGEARPRIANAKSLEEHAINRRLEIVLVPKS